MPTKAPFQSALSVDGLVTLAPREHRAPSRYGSLRQPGTGRLVQRRPRIGITLGIERQNRNRPCTA